MCKRARTEDPSDGKEEHADETRMLLVVHHENECSSLYYMYASKTCCDLVRDALSKSFKKDGALEDSGIECDHVTLVNWILDECREESLEEFTDDKSKEEGLKLYFGVEKPMLKFTLTQEFADLCVYNDVKIDCIVTCCDFN